MSRSFSSRHIGPSAPEIRQMLETLGHHDTESLIHEIIPEAIRVQTPLESLEPLSESAALQRLSDLSRKNILKRSLIGTGYYDTILPPVIQRNILENPGWYTAYTPYQAEISQGRMEALLNFQTMVTSLTGMEIANASLLDEATAAAEGVALAWGVARKPEGGAVLVDALCHPQTIQVVKTRGRACGIDVVEHDLNEPVPDRKWVAVISQYPNTLGTAAHPGTGLAQARESGACWIVCADLLALTVLQPPADDGADIVVGSTQRFGMPLGFGGPHAAFFATREKFKRQLPGRLIGVSKDVHGNTALRLSLQTREQHIRRDKATSNICTAQVLPAVIASMYAVYHGPEGLQAIARRVSSLAHQLHDLLEQSGVSVLGGPLFDTIVAQVGSPADEKALMQTAEKAGYNFRSFGDGRIGISLDEKSDEAEVMEVAELLGASAPTALPDHTSLSYEVRDLDFLPHPVFHSYQSETQMLRYLKRLEEKDISLTRSMIPLGSCTMKLNATAEMIPITWDGFAGLHPYVPEDQAVGYRELIGELEGWLAALTGFDAVSLQPNAGSQGEYAGLLAIKKFHESKGEGNRSICLIPESAHGTNFASAVMVGFQVVVVPCDESGNVDVERLRDLATEHRENLAALMVTYPSTHGVFESAIQEICQIVHDQGGQVYMDGANLNAQVGWTTPGTMGADVCHLNLHKTFCIPHGGGGPGVGPIGVARHLSPFLPGDPLAKHDSQSTGPVSAAKWGSAAILTISWAYIAMMGGKGLRQATAVAMLNANYLAEKLNPQFPVLYRGASGRIAHECILDCRIFRECGVEVEDIAKRLMDFGFHAPTMSWPVAGTLMVEPTESESLDELDRFCEAMSAIYGEISAIRDGQADVENNPLKNAPHTAECVVSDSWDYPYPREQAAFPVAWTRESKYWPPVGRVDNVYGDRNLFCSCYVPPEETAEPEISRATAQ